MVLVRERNLPLAALKVHRSVIATIVDPLRRTPLSQHPMIRRFLEAGLLSRPHRRIVKHIWSVAAVLDTPTLREWVPAQHLGRPKLSWRATLLALAPARRARGLSLVHIDGNHMFRRRDSWRFILAFRMKQDHHLDIFHLLW